MFPDAADLAVRQGERFAQHVRRRRRRDQIERLLWTILIYTTIIDEFTGAIGEGAQLQSTRVAAEEGVVLRNLDGTLIGNGGRFRGNGRDVLDTRFYLNVAGHEAIVAKIAPPSLPYRVAPMRRREPKKGRPETEFFY